MKWSSIKNIMIVLLVIVNLALLALVGAEAWRSGRNTRETGERMIAVLEKNGIAYLPDSIPEPMEEAETITAPTALARFLEYLHGEGYVCTQITAMYADRDETGAGRWMVETDAWPFRFAVDGATGEVTVAG